MQWDEGPFAGFSRVEPWLPLTPDWRKRNVAAMRDDPASMLSLVRALLAARRAHNRCRSADGAGSKATPMSLLMRGYMTMIIRSSC